jgi:hypothetical protein
MRGQSLKRAREHKIYLREAARWLTGKRCVRCGQAATQVHHAAGRESWLLLAKEYWLAMCGYCHRWVTDNGKAAAAKGWKYEVTKEQHEQRKPNKEHEKDKRTNRKTKTD